MAMIGRAARELIDAIRETASDYVAEIRQGVRIRGFARTLASRVGRAAASRRAPGVVPGDSPSRVLDDS